MDNVKLPEFWLRGPVEGVPGLLQPIAHALVQAQLEINELIKEFPQDLLWTKPAGLASPAFHLQHIAGVIDRMITYKHNLPLSEQQFDYLNKEGHLTDDVTVDKLLVILNHQIEKAIAELKATDVTTLTDFRGVGRKNLPSTVGGLLFHMAEHTMRHTGQLLVTVNVLKNWV
ncbi:DinB family protein [Mucilaginibacter ginkgonis]|uniref:DinB family protein n=1 Tax=Mucilaginibacter ginkgonis TaxID=2682091 RepID=A0A6I4I3R6_9SPHI|nr:DinB family protein [Mucilaginibacter ginkgonis]QQL50493.1 DinB family protein [Mucilaginibacter ginkgonis]